MSAFAIYIPCIYKNITEEMIAQTFYRKKVGSVINVDLVAHGEKYNHAHVFFESMYPFGQGAEQMRQVAEGKSVKLQYSKNEHTFWLMLKNNREYDGVSKKGWYDVEAENAKKAEKEEEMHREQEHAVWLTNGGAEMDNAEHAQWQEEVLCEQEAAEDREEHERIQQEIAAAEGEEGIHGTVSSEYAASLECEVGRLQNDLRHANDMIASTRCVDQTEDHMFTLRRENDNLRWAFNTMWEIKMPCASDRAPPILGSVSAYNGGSLNYGAIVHDEIVRLTRDNDILRINANVLSCMPDRVPDIPSHVFVPQNDTVTDDESESEYEYDSNGYDMEEDEEDE